MKKVFLTKNLDSPKLIKALKNGKVGVIPTDTLYGLVGTALEKEVVQRIYSLKDRSPDKATIVLISKIKDMERFEIDFKQKEEFLLKHWPGKISIILPCPLEEFSYIHRGKKTIAFRIPDNEELRELLGKVGPLVAPTVNPEGEEPAKTITEAKNYFGNTVDFYVDQGKKVSEPSTLIQIQGESVKVLREGASNFNY